MSCGRIALERAGIPVTNYYASEIDKYAIKVTQANYPDTVQLGCITGQAEWELPKIDLVIGGSPCQGFSFAGKQLNFDDHRSKLFFDFIEALHRFQPKYFMLENVKMKKEYQDVITRMLGGIEPIEINSALVSAQNRRRLYWTNIPGIEQPEDKGILLKDIIETDFVDVCHTLSDTALKRLERRKYSKPKLFPGKTGTLYPKNNSGQLCLDAGTTLLPVGFVLKDKSQTILSTIYKENAKSMIKRDKEGLLVGEFVDRDKAHCIDANYFRGGNLKSYFEKHRRQLVFELNKKNNRIKDVSINNYGVRPHRGDKAKSGVSEIGRLHFIESKCYTITANHSPKIIQVPRGENIGGIKGNDGKTPTISASSWEHNNHLLGVVSFRKLTPLECERLQTVPDNYTNHVSNTQRYKMLGNGWTVDVIAHIFKAMKQDAVKQTGDI
jgi:DNA (cytosine-5)-methyltransferase 3A